MRSVYFVRHGDYANPRNIMPGRLPVELSAYGWKQAEKLAKYFSDKNINTIYSSAVVRCRQTIEIFSKQANLPILYDVRLVETLSAYQGFWFEGKVDWSHFFGHLKELGGENFTDIQNRAISFYKDVILKTEGNMVVSSHGDVILFLILYIKGLPLPQESEKHDEMPDYPKRGAVTEIKITSQETIISDPTIP